MWSSEFPENKEVRLSEEIPTLENQDTVNVSVPLKDGQKKFEDSVTRGITESMHQRMFRVRKVIASL